MWLSDGPKYITGSEMIASFVPKHVSESPMTLPRSPKLPTGSPKLLSGSPKLQSGHSFFFGGLILLGGTRKCAFGVNAMKLNYY